MNGSVAASLVSSIAFFCFWRWLRDSGGSRRPYRGAGCALLSSFGSAFRCSFVFMLVLRRGNWTRSDRLGFSFAQGCELCGHWDEVGVWLVCSVGRSCFRELGWRPSCRRRWFCSRASRRSLMADSGTVNVPSVAAPSQYEGDSDVAIACSSSDYGLKQLGKTNREEHDNVLKRSLKRRRVSADVLVNPTEKENLINAFQKEIDGLFEYFIAVLVWKLGSGDEKCGSVNSSMACMLEGSNLPFSQLADAIYEKLKANEEVTLASVQRDVHFISSRLSYGMDTGNTDFFEDESESSLWCWEVRELKSLPKNKRKLSKDLRRGREKVRERIAALSEILSVLKMPENQANCMANFKKASEKLNKTLSLEEICLLVQKLTQKSEDEIAMMESRSKEKELLKEAETNKRNVEKEMKKHAHELQKVKSQSERELKWRQTEAEKAERRREKEQAEAKKQLSIQKQASLMERFLKSNKSNNPENLVDKLSEPAMPSGYSGKNFNMIRSTTVTMDSALSQQDSMNIEDLRKSHFAAWHKMSHSSKSQHWGIRCKPKTKFINELKLQGSPCEPEASKTIKAPRSGNACSEMGRNDKAYFSMFTDEIEEHTVCNQACQDNDYIGRDGILLPRGATKLLQFDKSYRPAYYGSWSKKSIVVGPRRPFAKDNDLDYDFDSDEEWEEEEPGESLSDCDKDDEEENLEDNPKSDGEDENEDGFFVPDGYLSENEGVQVDSMPTDCTSDEARISPGCMPETNSEEVNALLRHQKYVDNVTQQALRRNQPHIITNFMHEKSKIATGKDLSGTSKMEEICLHMLCLVACPGGPVVQEPFANQSEDPDVCNTQNRNNTTRVAAVTTISGSLLPELVCCIQSNPNGMAKLIESLHQNFPGVPKTQLRNKVREICEFVNNRWQVKKELLDKLGMPVSPDKGGRPKGIATLFSSKRCLPRVFSADLPQS